MNSPIVPSDGIFIVKTIDRHQMELLIKDNEIKSFIGHISTAEMLSKILGKEIECNRGMWNGQGKALCFKLKKRKRNSNKELSISELKEIGYSFQLIEKLI